MNRLPNFFIIGAPKAGTTALSEYLRAHSQVFFSDPKEPHYFNDDFSARHTNDFETYQSYFKNATDQHKAIGEGSVFYLSSKTAVDNILKKVPNAKFIIMLRDPVSMSHSWHAQAVHSFGETVIDFEKSWHLQWERQKGENIPKINYVREALQYAKLCKLGEQVKRLIDVVERKKLHFIYFNDFNKDPKVEYTKVLDFLAIDQFTPSSFEKVNASKGYKSIVLKQLVELIPYYKRKFGVRFNFNLGVWKKLNSYNTAFQKRKPISDKFKKELSEYFYEDVALLSKTLNRDMLKEWGFKK